MVDEVHTPDSSRYWLAHSYEERHAAGEEPENIDKGECAPLRAAGWR